MKFKRKPEIVQAFRITTQNIAQLAAWCEGVWRKTHDALGQPVLVLEVQGQTGDVLNVGDWVIKDAKGFHACTHDVFKATYDPSPHLLMVCGPDCQPGDNVCNNYCNQAPQKGPMRDHPPDGPDVEEWETIRKEFQK